MEETFVIELAQTYDAVARLQKAESMYAEVTYLGPASDLHKKSYARHVDRWIRTDASVPALSDARSAPGKR